MCVWRFISALTSAGMKMTVHVSGWNRWNEPLEWGLKQSENSHAPLGLYICIHIPSMRINSSLSPFSLKYIIYMDKSWISLPRSTTEYKIGLHQFLDFAFARSSVNGEIACPCPKCKFKRWQVRSVVYEHCIIRQFPRKYLFWAQHGEYDYVANNLEIG